MRQPTGSVARSIRKNCSSLTRAQTRANPDRDVRFKSPACEHGFTNQLCYRNKETVCIKVQVIQNSGPLFHSTVLDETWALARASSKFSFCVCIAVIVILSFGDLDSGHNNLSGGKYENQSKPLGLQCTHKQKDKPKDILKMRQENNLKPLLCELLKI